MHSEESLLDQELDLTDHHKQISSGITTLKKLYQSSRSEARKRVETAYIEKLEKIPNRLIHLQSQLTSLKFFLISCERTASRSKFSFNLLKSCGPSGIFYISISGFSELLTVSGKNQRVDIYSSIIPEITVTLFNEKDKEILAFSLPVIERLARLPVEQMSLTEKLLIFENRKNSEVDFCLLITAELARSDVQIVLRAKAADLQAKIEKIRMEAQGINLKKEFKASCCECFIN
jgi:hypothetical protein